jgi:hypothetical protein
VGHRRHAQPPIRLGAGAHGIIEKNGYQVGAFEVSPQ